ncbi:SH3 domain-containing protein [Sphingobacterium sp. PU5-4]|uniref:SH3 domain-containing protein n=1 Tax=Sphingobacterium tenebrionis TaxID=3111775 RepID=A0ABU8I554_9SPHI
MNFRVFIFALSLAMMSISFSFAQAPAAYEVVEEFNFYQVHDQKETLVFANMAYIREEPSTKSKLLDSLALGTELKYIGADAINPTLIRGMKLPWYYIEYVLNGQKKRGYMWAGLLAVGSNVDKKTGNTFLHGIAWQNQEEDNNYYWTELKVLDKNKQLIDTESFAYLPSSQSFSYNEIADAQGLANSKNIIKVSFSGESCGIYTFDFYFSWDGKQLHSLPETSSVSDAGIFYYSEELVLPNTHNKGKQIIVKRIEQRESESDINDETVSEVIYKVEKSEEIYEWDGLKFLRSTI